MRLTDTVHRALQYCWHNLPYLLVAEAIFWSPCIVTATLAILVNPWWWTACGAVIAFWAGPFTPAMPLQFALAVALKGAVRGIHNIVRRVHNARQRRWL